VRTSEAEWRISTIGASNDGILTWEAARRSEVGRRAIEHNERDGRLIRLGRGVWRLRDHPFDLRCRERGALALAGPRAVLGLRSAARLHGCWAYRQSEVVEVLVERGRDHRTDLGRIAQTRWLPPSHITVVGGFRCTTLERTFFDLCGDPDDGMRLRHPVHERRMKQLYNDCVGRRGLTFTRAVAVHSTLARRGRSGTRLVRKLLQQFGPDHVPTRSDLETLFLELVRSRDLPDPMPQFVVSGPDGFVGTVDFAWPAHRLVVEVDSSWHDGPLDRLADTERDRRLAAAGYRVYRYRYGHIVLEPDRVIRELGAAMAPMAAVAAPRTGGLRSG